RPRPPPPPPARLRPPRRVGQVVGPFPSSHRPGPGPYVTVSPGRAAALRFSEVSPLRRNNVEPDRPGGRAHGRGRRPRPGGRPGHPARGAAPAAAAPLRLGALPGRRRAGLRAPPHPRQGRAPPGFTT